jgi:hypothetical protein
MIGAASPSSAPSPKPEKQRAKQAEMVLADPVGVSTAAEHA